MFRLLNHDLSKYKTSDISYIVSNIFKVKKQNGRADYCLLSIIQRACPD